MPHGAVALADPSPEEGAAAGAPDHAGIPEHPLNVVGNAPRRGGIGDEAALAVANGLAAGIEQRIARADLDLLVADAAGEADPPPHRQRPVAAAELALEAVVELARLLAGIAAARGHPDRQH